MRMLLQVIVGGVIAVGATAAWRFWDCNGFIAFIVVLGGLTLMYNAFNGE